jgi:hypothetical protein
MEETTATLAPTLLRGVAEVAGTSPDLALELGLTAWMRLGGAGPAETLAAMRAARTAILDVAEMDPSSEPLPLTGISPKTDLLTWAVYLADLVRRAAWSSQCDTTLIVERTVRRVAA